MNLRLLWLLPPLLLAGAQLEKPNLAALQGRAYNSLTGEPYAEQGVILRGLPPRTDAWTVQSDQDGRFSFEEMDPGSYVLCARMSDDGMPVNLKPGQVLRDIEFKVAPLGSIRGRVVDEDGKPVERALVDASDGTPRRMFATTDAAGEFRFPDILPGSYVLRATGRTAKSKEPFLPTYHPAAASAAGAIPVLVAGQEVQGVTIILRRGKQYRVRGTVIPSSPDTPLAELRLMMMPRVQEYAPATVGYFGGAEIRPDGSFDLGGYLPGSYYLFASRRGPANVNLGRVVVDIIDSDVTGVVLRLGAPLQIEGRMRMEGVDKSDFAGVRVQLRPLEYAAPTLGGATVDERNTFTLKDMSPDRHLVFVTGLPDRAYVKSIRLGGRETIDTGLDLSEMLTAPPLDILISPSGATVEGTVNQTGAWMCLMPDLARPELGARVKYATGTGEGKFTFAGIAPGEYRLYAFTPFRMDPRGNLEFLKPFESKAVKLSLKEGERRQADVKVLDREALP